LKRNFIPLFIFAVFLQHVNGNSPELALRTTWGQNDNQVQFRVEADARYGPQSFRVADDQYIILDGENGKLKVFDQSGFRTAKIVNRFARDFYFNSLTDYTLVFDNKIESFQNNLLPQHILINRDQIILPLTNNSNPLQPVRFSDGSRQIFKTDQTLKKGDPEIEVIRASGGQGEIRSGNQLLFRVDFPDDNLASLRYSGQDEKGHIFIEFEVFLQRMPLKIERQLIVFTPDGDRLATLKLPINNYCYVFRDIEIDPQGHVHQMYFSPEGMEIRRWDWFKPDLSDSSVIFEMPAYGVEYPAVPIIEQEQDTAPTKPLDLPQVTPEVALYIADTYATLEWQCSAQNLTNGPIKDPEGNLVQTPEWLYVGAIYSMPYKWGGFDTIESFLQGIADGYYAGDRATSAVSSYARGVDCSGYVSRCWLLPSHYSTRMMDDYIAQPYNSWEETLPGDACHREGHVRLIVGHRPDGSIDMVESAGFNWRVSYTNYHYSNLTTYMPRYYINMQGTPGNIPQPLLTSLMEWETPQLQWSVSGQHQISHYNLYISNDAENWIFSESLAAAERIFTFAPQDSVAVYYKLRSVSASDNESESLPSDGYGIFKPGRPGKALIIDAFDRTSATSGSWTRVYHNFAAVHGQALFNLGIPFETVPNEALTSGSLNLADYAAVIWIAGDESTADETFGDTEQSIIAAYLQQGGKLFVSGSEIGWDLDYRGSPQDKIFYNSILKADYESDDAGSNTVSGAASTVFSGITLHFDDGTKGVYEEDYPDAINAVSGGTVALKYGNGKNAAVIYKGIFNGGINEGQIFYLAFPFETIYSEPERNTLMSAVMDYFEITPTALAGNKNTQFPEGFKLLQNFPNPFNPATVISYQLSVVSLVKLTIYDALGREAATLVNEVKQPGIYTVQWNANGFPSGVYFYELKAGGQTQTRKMLLVR
jgi:hypothetical protein